MLKINMEYRKGILFIRLKGNLNATTAPKFIEYTMPIIKDYGIKYLVYNLNDLLSIDNIGEEALLKGQNEVSLNNGKVLLVNNNVNTNVKLEHIKDELKALELLHV